MQENCYISGTKRLFIKSDTLREHFSLYCDIKYNTLTSIFDQIYF